jgi:F-type H+-transporting ATPase subunit a
MPQLNIPATASRPHSFRIAQGETGPRTSETAAEGTHAAQGEVKEHKAGEVPAADLLFANAVFVALLMVLFGFLFGRRLHAVPKGFANLGEWLAESMRNFTVGIIGPGGERHVPLVGTIFLYILTMNLIGLIPGFHSPTSNVTNTLALGVVVFIYVQYWGIRTNGLGGYVRHFMGPSLGVKALGGKFPELFWLLGPIEIISELIKPFTLAIRLFGNIFGEDVILVVLAGLAGSLGGAAFGFIPLQLPIIFLSMLTSLVQALVFAILTCIYLSLVTHHGPSDEHGVEADETHTHAAEHRLQQLAASGGGSHE